MKLVTRKQITPIYVSLIFNIKLVIQELLYELITRIGSFDLYKAEHSVPTHLRLQLSNSSPGHIYKTHGNKYRKQPSFEAMFPKIISTAAMLFALSSRLTGTTGLFTLQKDLSNKYRKRDEKVLHKRANLDSRRTRQYLIEIE